MEYRRFGKTELNISVLTFGGMRVVDPVGHDQCIETVHAAVKSGINHIETARFYGNSEEIIGEALQDLDRSKLVITTKIPPTPADAFRMLLENSMEKLGVDYIDNIDIHGVNNEDMYYFTTKEDGALEGARKAQEEGLFGHLGFSTHGELDLILKMIETDEFESVNLHYYYVRQRNLAAIEFARMRDMGVLIISPTDKGGMLYDPPQTMVDLCAPYTPIGLNHRFCLTTPGVTTCTVGAKHPDELLAHLAIADGGAERTAEEQALIDGLDKHKRQALAGTMCTSCHKCMPCPENINIPRLLEYRNAAVGLDLLKYGRSRYGMVSSGDHWTPAVRASACKADECGECLPKCPEKLDIPALMADIEDRLGGETGSRLWADTEAAVTSGES